MKKLLSIALIATSLSTLAIPGLDNMPSQSDFAATAAKAAQNAEIVAEEYAASRGVELVDVVRGAKSGRYEATTNTDCSFTVKVGLLFRANVISQSNCQ